MRRYAGELKRLYAIGDGHDVATESKRLMSAARAAIDAIEQAITSRQDPFSLADRDQTARLLETAGFADVGFTDVREPVYYGRDVAAALQWVSGFSSVHDALRRLDPAATGRALQRLRETLAAHATSDGVWFESRAWIVTARCQGDRAGALAYRGRAP